MNEPMSIQEIFPGAATELPQEDELGFPKAPPSVEESIAWVRY